MKIIKEAGPGMHNFKWYKNAELSEISRKNTIFALRRGDHTFSSTSLSHLHKKNSRPLRSFQDQVISWSRYFISQVIEDFK